MSVLRAFGKFTVLLLLLFVASFRTNAGSMNPDPLIPRADLFGNPQKNSAGISPDKKWIAWLAPVDGVLNVWVAPIGDMNAATPVTQDKKRGIRSYYWTYDSAHLLYRQDAGGDENFHVFAVDVTNRTTKI